MCFRAVNNETKEKEEIFRGSLTARAKEIINTKQYL
jgi:hypothetical protein